MKKLSLLLVAAVCSFADATAQVVSSASFLKAHKKVDVVVPYRVTDEGVETPIEWGLDLAWLSEDNIRTGVLYAGKDLINIVRTSYTSTESVEGGELSTDQVDNIRKRAALIKKYFGTDIAMNINHDHPSVNSWYNAQSAGSTGRGKRWAKVIDLTIKKYAELGLSNVVSISPYNEPDYGWDQGYNSSTRKSDFLNTAKSLREDYDGAYDNVRMCGGNTLNDDKAYEWWNYLKEYLDEGNTHQLAGSFDNYANFFKQVRDYGHHATADELHNTMEAMVGVEYGMQTGIWWGTCEYTRSQFMKATDFHNPGKRIAYGEHRNNWTAASIYRHPNGRMQLFGGTSERQAVTTTYNFASVDRPVWVNGEGSREYVMYLHGGSGYQTGQTNCERVLDVQSGRDIMPHIDGTYRIMNVNSGRLLGTEQIYTGDWHSISQRGISSSKALQWVVEPLADTVAYDLSYCFITQNTGKGMTLDILNWNMSGGADVGVFPGGLGTNEQWYLEYAGEGSFYIRSRFSTLYLEVANSSKDIGANVQMGYYSGKDNQKWRFIAVDARPELVAPEAPTELKAQANNASVQLTWTASTSSDVASYTVLRSEDGNDYYTIAKDVKGNAYCDNEASDGVTYYYQVYAVDKCYNYSECSNAVQAAASGDRGLVMHLPLNDNLYDTTENGNHAAVYGATNWTEGKLGNCLYLESTTSGDTDGDNFVQLPYTVANHDELTVACWVYWKGGNAWQRIWDFGNGTNQYMFFAPSTDGGMRFAIKNGGDEQMIRVSNTFTRNRWTHVAVTLGADGAVLYINGAEKSRNANISIKPSDFNPVLNYIGRSQFTADPFFKGSVDDFRIYNYVLTADEVKALVDLADGIENVDSDDVKDAENVKDGYELSGRRSSANGKGVVVYKGRKVLKNQ